jgi:predicted ferric reductase
MKKFLVILGWAVIVAAAFTVPFYYETQTLWYKTGADKVMLRAGQLAGLLALVLLISQIILSLRVRFLEALFGGANLIRWHRANGLLIGCLALSHIILVLAPEGFDNLPIGIKYWPEMVGGGLFLLIFMTVILSHFRSSLKLDYKKWRLMHMPLGYLILVLVLIHVVFVSESFEQGIPRIILLSLFTGLTLLVVIVKTKR